MRNPMSTSRSLHTMRTAPNGAIDAARISFSSTATDTWRLTALRAWIPEGPAPYPATKRSVLALIGPIWPCPIMIAMGSNIEYRCDTIGGFYFKRVQPINTTPKTNSNQTKNPIMAPRCVGLHTENFLASSTCRTISGPKLQSGTLAPCPLDMPQSQVEPWYMSSYLISYPPALY